MNDIIRSCKKLWKDLGMRRWIFLLLVGILLVVIAIPVEKRGTGDEAQEGSYGGNDDSGTVGTAVTGRVSAYEAELEARLTAFLGQIEGAGAVEVMVTIRRSSELILQSDTSWEDNIIRETDSQGGTRDNTQRREENQTVLTGGSGGSQPYVVGEIMPQIEGVVVACEGGDRPTVQAEISAAVQALFDLAPHKIKVCKMASP